ncbi:MAG: multiprotein bridging factor aMBF1 [Methanomassiliicoccaceae archaeon]|jgi:putative transcription factor|nr:multiprotein bridging factor aMBF1 [Methanomassiliicoccaceae archaeon]
MLCELCGKEAGPTRPVFVEGTKLNVCQNCMRFGEEYKAQQAAGSGKAKANAPAPSAAVIEERLQKREKRMQTKDVYANTQSVELVDDYGRVIKDARLAAGMDLEQFAASIFEKKGILAKVEANDLVPDEKLMKKIEKALNIKLTEVVQSSVGTNKTPGTKMTLENFIKKK